MPAPAVAIQVPAKRVYDASYLPGSLWDKVDARDHTFVAKNVQVNQWLVNGRPVYGITRDGATNYFDNQGAEITGADKTRLQSELGVPQK